MAQASTPRKVIIYADESGGDKSTQDKDIEQAKIYWKEYQSHD